MATGTIKYQTKQKLYMSENLINLYNDVNSNGYIMFGCGGQFTSLLTNGDATSQGYGYAIKTPAGFAEGLMFVAGKISLYSFRVSASGTLEMKSKVQFSGF